MSPKQWGTPTWIFMHTLVANIKSSSFPIIGNQLINNIISICHNLPCPDCTVHATSFWKKVIIKNIKTKEDLINVIFVFHNLVNKRNKSPQFMYSELVKYENTNIIRSYNNFSKNFNTNGNMSLINEAFRRNMALKRIHTWIGANINHFAKDI